MPRFHSQIYSTLAAVACLMVGAPAAMGKKKSLKEHVHGHAKISVAVEGQEAAVDIDLPGDALFGFEHAPKTDAEKATVTQAVEILTKRQNEIIIFAADKGCKATKTEVEAEGAGIGGGDKGRHDHEDHAGHSDAEIEYRFTCSAPLTGSEVRIGLFKLFPRIKQIRVDTLSGQAQGSKTVSSEKDAIKL